jgi:hypothetical protein
MEKHSTTVYEPIFAEMAALFAAVIPNSFWNELSAMVPPMKALYKWRVRIFG